MSKTWFEVDKKGLKELQRGKPITHLMRELIQNALDEDITECNVVMNFKKGGFVTISVEDDSPIGFTDLSDAWTLFRSTSKRSVATVRGRFNLGEKQVFALCDTAEIRTTTGGVLFDKDGRHTLRKKREKGSIITVTLKMNKNSFDMCHEYCKEIKVPKDITMSVCCNGVYAPNIQHELAYKTITGNLQTELLEPQDGGEPKIIKRTRETQVFIYEPGTHGAILYEMGLPVCKIDCKYSLDIQQKIPMSADRDKVSQTYLKDLYGLVLNEVVQEVSDEEISDVWVREATSSKNVNDNTVKDVTTKRYGDKVVFENPFDANANDEAISNGYKVLSKNEVSSDERGKFKDLDLIKSSSALFGKKNVDPVYVNPLPIHDELGEMSKRIAREFLGLNITVKFMNNPKSDVIADYAKETNVLRYNIGRMDDSYWALENRQPNEKFIDLLIHELGHSKGNHTDHTYHECITMLGSKLFKKALNDPGWFTIRIPDILLEVTQTL